MQPLFLDVWGYQMIQFALEPFSMFLSICPILGSLAGAWFLSLSPELR